MTLLPLGLLCCSESPWNSTVEFRLNGIVPSQVSYLRLTLWSSLPAPELGQLETVLLLDDFRIEDGVLVVGPVATGDRGRLDVRFDITVMGRKYRARFQSPLCHRIAWRVESWTAERSGDLPCGVSHGVPNCTGIWRFEQTDGAPAGPDERLWLVMTGELRDDDITGPGPRLCQP